MHADEQNRVFGEWLDSYRNLLFKLVSVYAFTPADRDDLFQEVAVQVWGSIPRFRGECAVKSWVYRVAPNSAIAWTKRETKHRRGKQPLVDDVPIRRPLVPHFVATAATLKAFRLARHTKRRAVSAVRSVSGEAIG